MRNIPYCANAGQCRHTSTSGTTANRGAKRAGGLRCEDCDAYLCCSDCKSDHNANIDSKGNPLTLFRTCAFREKKKNRLPVQVQQQTTPVLHLDAHADTHEVLLDNVQQSYQQSIRALLGDAAVSSYVRSVHKGVEILIEAEAAFTATQPSSIDIIDQPMDAALEILHRHLFHMEIIKERIEPSTHGIVHAWIDKMLAPRKEELRRLISELPECSLPSHHLVLDFCSGHCSHGVVTAKALSDQLVNSKVFPNRVEVISVDCSSKFGTPNIQCDIMAWDRSHTQLLMSKYPNVVKVIFLGSPTCTFYSIALTTWGPGNTAISPAFKQAGQRFSDRLSVKLMDIYHHIPAHLRLIMVLENPADGALKNREVSKLFILPKHNGFQTFRVSMYCLKLSFLLADPQRLHFQGAKCQGQLLPLQHGDTETHSFHVLSSIALPINIPSLQQVQPLPYSRYLAIPTRHLG